MYAIVFAAKVFVGDGSQDVRVNASNVLVSAPDGESGDPAATVDGFQDFGEVLVGYVEDGKTGFVVLVNNEIFIKRYRLVMAFLKKEGDRTEGFEGNLPICPTFPMGGGRLQVVKSFLVGESPRVMCFTAFLNDRVDHVPVSRSFVPQSPESMEPLVELDKVWVDVCGVGGGEGKADPEGSST